MPRLRPFAPPMPADRARRPAAPRPAPLARLALAAAGVAGAAACAADDHASVLAPSASPAAARVSRGAPAAPAGVAAAAGDARATVSWRAPASGWAPITSYTVTAAPGGASVTVAAPATTAAVAGLANGTAYTFTVVARNAYGAGAPSAPSAPVTPTAPAPAPAPAPAGRWVMGYYVGYQRALYPETSVDFTYMTHVAMGAVQATPTGGVTTDFYLDNTTGPAVARTLASRAHAAGRKAILMLGGAGHRDNLASAASDAYRATFVANLLRTMDALGYDGLDVDWEPIPEADKPLVLRLLRDLRAARPGILLTFPVGWNNANWGADPWFAQVAPLVDQMNAMTYQMADNWGGWTSWHTAALYGHGGDHPSSIASTVDAYRAIGVPAAKLGFGVGAYGSCWRGPTAPLQPLAAGAAIVASDNAMSYANIMAQYYSAAAYRWDATARAGYLTFAAPSGPQQCTMVSYEDPRSVAEKAAYARAAGLGGAIVWTVGQGYMPNAAAGDRDPLLKAAFSALAN